MTTMLSRLAALHIVYDRPTDRDLQAAAPSGVERESQSQFKKSQLQTGPTRELISNSNSKLGFTGNNLEYLSVAMVLEEVSHSGQVRVRPEQPRRRPRSDNKWQRPSSS